MLFALFTVGLASADPLVALSGTCPNPVTVTVHEATPNAQVAFVAGATGAGPGVAVPAGRCAGLVTGLSTVVASSVAPTPQSGSVGLMQGPLQPQACNLALQIVDLGNCTLSNVIRVGRPNDADLDQWGDGEGDCDDSDAAVYPGARDRCGDGIDSNCDGTDC